MRTSILEVAEEAALRGNLNMLESLADSEEGIPFLLRVLEQAPDWLVRVRAAELLATFASVMQLYDADRNRLAVRLHELDREAAMDSVVLDETQRARLHELDPYRMPGVSDVPHHLGGWFASIAEDLR